VAEPPRGDITFEAVSFRYPGTGHDVLGDLDLVLDAGRSTAVVGVNGAGKTTLVTLLARLRDPTAGRILIDGVPLANLPAREWQRQVAVVYQDFTRFPLTARENVALDLLGEPVDPETLARVARRAGAADLVAGLRDGWETVLSAQYEGGQDLSGGQWQRVALARALYAVERGARLLVLDEPTAQLDVRAEARFYDRFLEITGGVTSVVISHRFSTVRRADRIAVLDGGRITELGDHEELLRAGGTYREMFELQVSRFGPKEGRR
ncbi:MAG TPA: ATP-binding cassette domain-containing protein, partial [Actinoallomurus sp.]|nr:ATP-binding cassette domain-containing protein [Actinoallomurus sp.]